MIISSSRILTSSGAAAVGKHVFSGPKNESITLVQGSRVELLDMVSDAKHHGAKYAIRHFKISPGQETTREQALVIAGALGHEFGFNTSRGVLVEHQKNRYGNAGFNRHWHFLVPEVDPGRGRVLSDKWTRPRQEKIARIAEIQLGHTQVTGKWSASVEHSLRAAGCTDLADRVTPIAGNARPREAYSSTLHQAAARNSLSMPELKAIVVNAWSCSDNGNSFRAALVEHDISIRPGDKGNTWIAEKLDVGKKPVLIGSIARLVKAKPPDVALRISSFVSGEKNYGEARNFNGTTVAHRPSQGRSVGTDEAVDHGSREGYPSGSEGPEIAGEVRSQRNIGTDVCSDESRRNVGQSAAVADAHGFADTGGGVKNRSDRPTSRARRGIKSENRATVGRNRIQAQKDERALAASAIKRSSRLAELSAEFEKNRINSLSAEDRRARAFDVLRKSSEIIINFLASEPWSCSKTRSAKETSLDLEDEVRARQRSRAIAVEEAREHYLEAQQRTRVIDKVAAIFGIRTRSTVELSAARHLLKSAECTQNDAAIELPGELAHVNVEAKRVVAQRQLERDSWLSDPRVVLARHHDSLNNLIMSAIEDGDCQLEYLVMQDLKAARVEMLRREPKEQICKHLQDESFDPHSKLEDNVYRLGI